MTIAGLGGLGSASLLSPQSSSVISRAPLSGLATSLSSELDASTINLSSASNLTLAGMASDASLMQAPPPNTVQSGRMSSITATISSSASANGSSSANAYSVQSSVESASYDISYNTPLQTLQSEGFLQPGDVLTASGVHAMVLQAQLSTTQSASVSLQSASSAGKSLTDGTQKSADVTTQQSASEQDIAVFITQDWMTPGGVHFTFQELIRVDQNTQSEQAGVGLAQATLGAFSALENPVGDACTALAQDAKPASAAAVVSAPAAPASTTSTTTAAIPSAAQDMLSEVDSLLNIPSADSSIAGMAVSSASTASTASSGGDTTLQKQTDSLLTLLESLAKVLQPAGTSTPSTNPTS